MNSLDIARQGKSAARQIVAQMNAGVLTAAELARLMTKVAAGYEQMLPSAPPRLAVAELPIRRGFQPTLIQGDRP